jgi:hypothetical protein
MVWKEELLFFFTSSLFCSSIRFILKVESVLLLSDVPSIGCKVIKFGCKVLLLPCSYTFVLYIQSQLIKGNNKWL